MGTMVAILALACAVCACSLVPTVREPKSKTPVPTSTSCQARVTIETNPAGAEIALDGIAQGAAPLHLTLPPGSYAVVAEMEGFAPRSITVNLACGPRLVTIELADLAPPTLSLGEAPRTLAWGSRFTIVAQAQDPSGIAAMELYVDGDLAQRASGDSLSAEIDTAVLEPGEHMLRVWAEDATGHEMAQEHAFRVVAPTVTVKPTVATAMAVPTPEPSPTPRPTAETRSVNPVEVYWAEITVPTYRYEQALYSDANAGHPYPLLHRDRVGDPEPRTYSVLVMRNAYLELTLLPELGGRIYQCRFLPTNETLFYNNKTIKPTHWGPTDRGWWLAVGGLEFCLPVDEHGYLTAQPWEAAIDRRSDGTGAVTMSVFERTREIDAQVAISLAPGQSRFEIDSRLTNISGQEQSLQYWLNAMLAPGADSVGPNLRFYYPTDEMIVHSTGDAELPGAAEKIAWPIHDGRDLGTYATWRNWLGVFAPHVEANYTAVYDHEAQLGMVRVFPYEVARGVKLFGFGRDFGDSGAYTDDGSQYIEMWGGWTTTFWDYATLGAGQTLAWQEAWYPIAQTDGVTMATKELAAKLERRGVRVVGTVASTRRGEWRLDVMVGGESIAQETLRISPEQATLVDIPVIAGNRDAPWTVRIMDEHGNLTLEQALDEQEKEQW